MAIKDVLANHSQVLAQADMGRVEENPFGVLDPRRRKLHATIKLAWDTMHEKFGDEGMASLRAKAMMGGRSSQLQWEYDVHTRLAAMVLDGDERPYAELYKVVEAQIMQERHPD